MDENKVSLLICFSLKQSTINLEGLVKNALHIKIDKKLHIGNLEWTLEMFGFQKYKVRICFNMDFFFFLMFYCFMVINSVINYV